MKFTPAVINPVSLPSRSTYKSGDLDLFDLTLLRLTGRKLRVVIAVPGKIQGKITKKTEETVVSNVSKCKSIFCLLCCGVLFIFEGKHLLVLFLNPDQVLPICIQVCSQCFYSYLGFILHLWTALIQGSVWISLCLMY